jgi:hypothetical protein
LAHALVGRLKSYGILADGLFSQDRKFSFDKKYIETEAAQNWMVSNLIAKEVDIVLHGDVEVFITDRTPIDLFAYYAYQHDTELSRACWAYAKEWAKTYDALYYLEPLPYHDDGKRPSDDFRTAVDNVLVNDLIPQIPNVKHLTRHSVLNDILRTIGFEKPGVKMDFTRDDAQTLANHLKLRVVVKHRKGVEDALSDYDIWLLTPTPLAHDLEAIRTYAKGLFGQFVDLDINTAVDTSTFDFGFSIFYPVGMVYPT